MGIVVPSKVTGSLSGGLEYVMVTYRGLLSLHLSAAIHSSLAEWRESAQSLSKKNKTKKQLSKTTFRVGEIDCLPNSLRIVLLLAIIFLLNTTHLVAQSTFGSVR